MFAACVRDMDAGKLKATQDETALVTLSLSTPATRAETPGSAEENAINAIDVLLFDTGDKFKYRAHGTQIVNQSTAPNYATKQFEVRLPIGGAYKVVVIANARAAVQATNLPISTIVASGGASRETVLNSIVHAATPGVALSATNFPMWGELAAPVTISETSTSISPDIQLTRAVARIDLSLHSDISSGTFVLDNVVRLYNYHSSGHVAQKIVSGSYSADCYPVASSKTPGSYISYTTAGTAFTKMIYAFEAENIALDQTDWVKNTCLVVGGKYNGSSANTYYRVDFTDDDDDPLNLTRNHHYNVVIKNVKDYGWATPELAYTKKTSNLTATITDWNDGGMEVVEIDGQHYLRVEKSHVDLYIIEKLSDPDPDAKILRAATNHPDGWKIEVPDDFKNWLEVTGDYDPNDGDSSNDEDLQPIEIKAKTATGSDQTGYFYIVVDNLKKRIDVTQHNSPELLLSLVDASDASISELSFNDGVDSNNDYVIEPPLAKQIKAIWSPSSSAPLIVTPIRNNISYTATYTNFATVNSVPGTSTVPYTFTVQPTAILAENLDPMSDLPYTRSTNLLFHMTLEDGQHKNLPFTITQEFDGPLPLVDPAYLMDGNQHSFSVRSNFPFEITELTDPDDVFTLHTTSGASNTGAGTEVSFTLKDDMSDLNIKESEVTLKISSPTGAFLTRTIVIQCVSGIIQPNSNSYIVSSDADATGILIPVARCNESDLGEQLSATQSFNARLVWTDNPDRVALNSAVRRYLAVSKGSAGYLYVRSGSGTGNAVIAIRNSANRILWSWHVWVVNPNDPPAAYGSKNLMDRNLGAITKTPNAVTTLGLLYQWGRKDPFPGTASVGASVEPILYTESSNPVVSTEVAGVGDPIFGNIGITVANPLTFLCVGGAADWYSSSADAGNESLWSASKTIYDPCPPGWRVPEASVWMEIVNGTIFPWNSTDRGCSSWTHGGFYPAAGNRFDSSGRLANLNNIYVWSASTGTNSSGVKLSSALRVDTANSLFYWDVLHSRAHAFPIRCVEE